MCWSNQGGRCERANSFKGGSPGGNFTTLALSHDARTIYFAFAERSGKKPAFASPDRKSFKIYSMAADGSGLRQLTDGVEDDFDPCPLPDGGVAFMSSRRGGFARCNNPWEPCASYTLHRMDADGRNFRRLSAHETSEWHPSVLNDGRLVYIRWDYVDRSAANFHGLWTSNPDGSGVASLFGNYTMRINACYQPRAIPGSEKLLFLAGAHHADVGGSLVMLDPRRVKYHPETGEDLLDSIEVLTPEVCFPESVGWPKSYFHSPWPFSEQQMLVAFSFEPLPGMSSGEGKDTRTGLYYFDRFGNLELLYRDPGISAMYPIPLRPRARPSAMASSLDPSLGDEGEFLLADVNRSLLPMPADRPIRELRVFQLLPKGGNHTANEPRIGHANAENARMLLGAVPVASDGSAYFRAPAGKPLYFQAVDARGRAVQSMRSAAYLQPGERRGCIGCHEAPGTAAAARPTLAMRRPPSRLEPGPEGTRPFSFPLLVQPMLDRHCVRCHDGTEGPGRSNLALTGQPAKKFTASYANLKPFLRWYEWGGDSISQIATHPGRIGADASRLSSILEDENHRPHLAWDDADRRKLYLWLDANVPFYGTYDPGEQVAQREGKVISPPGFQ
jgi:cytochrome c553